MSPPRDDNRFERVFTLRLWREGGAGETTFRGSLVEVGEARRFFFTQLGDLKDFLALQLDEPIQEVSATIDRVV